jgi:hypothetical protein
VVVVAESACRCRDFICLSLRTLGAFPGEIRRRQDPNVRAFQLRVWSWWASGSVALRHSQELKNRKM